MKIILTQQEVRSKFGFPQESLIELFVENASRGEVVSSLNTFRLFFPKITAKEIIDQCSNQGKGGKILHSTWLLDEDFYTKETTREGWKTIDLDLIGKGKTYLECEDLAKEKKKEIMNFAEVLYFFVEYEKQTGMRLFENEYTWTSSRYSDGSLAVAGNFVAGGVVSSRWRPGDSGSLMGVCLSRSE